MVEWEWDCSKTWLGISPVEEFLVDEVDPIFRPVAG